MMPIKRKLQVARPQENCDQCDYVIKINARLKVHTYTSVL